MKLDPRFKSVRKFHLDQPANVLFLITPSDKMTPRNLETLSEQMLMRDCTCHIDRDQKGNVEMLCGCKRDVIRS